MMFLLKEVVGRGGDEEMRWRIIHDQRGSAYAWITFFTFMWVFALVWFYFGAPLFNAGMEMANLNNFTSIPNAKSFYDFYSALYPTLPFLMIVFATIGFAKYASSVRQR